MLYDVYIQFRDSRNKMTIDTPSTCPHCGRTMSPQHVGESSSSDKSPYLNKGHFSVIFRCSFEDCLKYFVVEYIHSEPSRGIAVDYSYRPPIKVRLPENVEKVSPTFVEIYSQATVAESEKLDQIAGVGYRKAAEFLIKDYVISKIQMMRRQSKKYARKSNQRLPFRFSKLQALAKSVAWIGNDETHYVRRHNNKDLQDLKRFILASAQFIAADYDADDALSFTS